MTLPRTHTHKHTHRAAASSSTRTQVAVEVVHPVVGILTVSAILGAILSASWMWFMKSHATSMIKCTL